MKVRINYRILVITLLVILLFFAGGFIVFAYIYQLQDSANEIVAQNLESLKAAQELEITLFHMRGLTFNYILDKNPIWIDQLYGRGKEFLFALEQTRKTANTAEEINLVHQITELFSNYEQDLKTALLLEKKNKYISSNQILIHASRNLFDTIYEKCKAYSIANEKARSIQIAQIGKIDKTMRITMFVLGIVGILFGSILGLLISKILMKPISELVLKVRGAVDTELVEHIKMTRGEEIKELEHHVYKMIDNINRNQADLENNRRLLEHSERLAVLGKIAAGIAHEIRNPLTSIKMLLYSLKNDKEITKKNVEDLEVIFKEIDRMNEFIQTFLKFAKPAKPSLVPINIGIIFQETIPLIRPRLAEKKIQLLEKYLDSSNEIWVDPHQMKQVLMNLFINAVEAMPNGGTLTIETGLLKKMAGQRVNNFLQLKIIDTGTGISEDIKNNLFDPFVRGKEEGIGLGLSISKQIIELHHGWMEASNNPDGGASITVNLPFN